MIFGTRQLERVLELQKEKSRTQKADRNGNGGREEESHSCNLTNLKEKKNTGDDKQDQQHGKNIVNNYTRLIVALNVDRIAHVKEIAEQRSIEHLHSKTKRPLRIGNQDQIIGSKHNVE